MPEQLEPGTYVEEVGFRTRRIDPAPTSVTVLLGTCRRGPANAPVAVQSLSGFDQVFPDVRGSSLRRAARDFYSNGGRHALTVRVTDKSAALANLVEHDWQLLVVAPGVLDLAEANALCLRHRAFLVCDAAGDGALPAGLGSNAAAYFPPLAGPGDNRPCAPAVAGVFARIDAKLGVWKAPAGTEATLNGVLSHELTPQEINELRPRHVNALRNLPTVGAVVWGALTASGDPEWKYVPVRRLVLFLERSIEQGLRWVVLEPHDERLWAQARLSVNDFLFDQWRQGALAGTKADESYFVRCDPSTMTQADIDAGRLVLVVGVAPVKPTEFVVFRIEVRTSAPA
jgi:phage tail sheath protein FI